eukprot:COSAG01_NODE_15976_length_1281_cov_1.399323_1_plen_41_part_10
MRPQGQLVARAKRTRAAMRASARAHRHWLPSWGLGALALGA